MQAPYLTMGTRVHNPAARFEVGEDIFATGCIIPEERWRERAAEG